MSTQHTPGPWEVTNTDKDTITIVRRGVFTVAALWSSTQPRYEQEANARLIAAAPDMLQALAYVVNWHREHDSGEGELFGLDYVTACISALRQVDPEWRTTSSDEVTP